MSSQNACASENQITENPRRKVLALAVGAIICESGFHCAEKAALGTLVEILQSVITEIGRSSRQFAEVAYRTQPVVGDIILALAEMGINTDSINQYAKRTSRMAIATPGAATETKPITILHIGQKKNHPAHIPDHLPDFPDTHTYCFSQTYKQPVTEYEAIREKASQQKRDVEKALTRFASKTNDVINLFNSDDKDYLVIASQSNQRPYFDALMPRDQVFEEDEEYEAKLRKRRKADNGEDEDEASNAKEKSTQEETNPYLRNVKMPKKKSKNK